MYCHCPVLYIWGMRKIQGPLYGSPCPWGKRSSICHQLPKNYKGQSIMWSTHISHMILVTLTHFRHGFTSYIQGRLMKKSTNNRNPYHRFSPEVRKKYIRCLVSRRFEYKWVVFWTLQIQYTSTTISEIDYPLYYISWGLVLCPLQWYNTTNIKLDRSPCIPRLGKFWTCKIL